LIVIAYLKTSKDKGKGKAISNLVVDGHEDESSVPGSEASVGYYGLWATQGESDDDNSNFEPDEFDSEEEEEEDGKRITLRNGRKLSHKRASRGAVRYSDDLEKGQDKLVQAAMMASTRDVVSGALTSTGSSTRNVSRRAPLAAAVTERPFVMEQGFDLDSVVSPDSDWEHVDSEDEPIARKGRTTPGKGRGRNKVQGKIEFNADGIHHDSAFARKAARRQEKREIRMLEQQLGRRLTYVRLASNFSTVIHSPWTLTRFSYRQRNLQFSCKSVTLSFAMPGVTSKQLSKLWSPKKRSSLRDSK